MPTLNDAKTGRIDLKSMEAASSIQKPASKIKLLSKGYENLPEYSATNEQDTAP